MLLFKLGVTVLFMVNQCAVYGEEAHDLFKALGFLNLKGPWIPEDSFQIPDSIPQGPDSTTPVIKPASTTPVVKPPSTTPVVKPPSLINKYEYSIVHKRLNNLESQNRRFEKLTGKMDIYCTFATFNLLIINILYQT